MADAFRLRHDDTTKLLGAVDSATVIEIGDLLFLDGDDLKPAADQSDAGSEEANQAQFRIRSEVDHGTLVEIIFPPARVLAQ